MQCIRHLIVKPNPNELIEAQGLKASRAFVGWWELQLSGVFFPPSCRGWDLCFTGSVFKQYFSVSQEKRLKR